MNGIISVKIMLYQDFYRFWISITVPRYIFMYQPELP